MINNINSIVNYNGGQVTFYWESDLNNPTYYLYKNGLFLGTQSQSDYTFIQLKNNEVFRFEVFDYEPSIADIEDFYPGYFHFNFYTKPSEKIASYEIQEKVDSGDWRTLEILNTKINKSLYTFDTPWYNDKSIINIRIIPKYINNKDGEPFSFMREVITYPLSLNTTISVTDDNFLEIDAITTTTLENSLIITVPDPLI
jgi:hypothetical protein